MCRHGNSCVILEQPAKLERCGMFAGLSAAHLSHMVGAHCADLKPYQLAALGFLTALMQQRVRGCVVAREPGLGARTLIAVWLAALKCGNARPLRVASSAGGAPLYAAHMVGLVVAAEDRLSAWRTTLLTWAPGLRLVALDGGAGADAAAAQLATAAAPPAAQPPAAPPPMPADVVLVPTAALAAGAPLLRTLAALPWLAAVLEDVGDMPRDAFAAVRPLLAQSQQRVALERGAVPAGAEDASRLRNLTELVQPQVFDARHGQCLSMAHCASATADAVRRRLLS